MMKPPPGKTIEQHLVQREQTNAHALRVDNSVTVHRGDGRVHSVAPVQHHLPEEEIIRLVHEMEIKYISQALFSPVQRQHGAYFPIFAQGIESTETAAYW